MVMKNIIISLILIQAFLFNTFAVDKPTEASSQNETQNKLYYNELYQGAELREIYDPLKEYLLKNTDQKDQQAFLITSRKGFQNDNALDAIPRILTLDEANEIQRGVDQRARALRAFLKDHYSGKRYYAKAGIIPEEVTKRIISRSGESSFDGLVNPQTISFMYGPDIIRDANGKWRVIEDNPGFIGGLGDLKLVYDLILQKHQILKERFEFADPVNFYKSLARAYREKGLSYGGKTILYMIPPYVDNEDKRIEQIFTNEGIEVITPHSLKKLQISTNEIFLESNYQGRKVREKVGYIFMNGEHAWLDNTHPASRVRNILESANEYLKEKNPKPKIAKQILKLITNLDPITQLPNISELERLLNKVDYLDHRKSYAAGLVDAILRNKVGSNYSPGVDFIGDKEFYVYVESLIRHYLHEEPILKNIPTQKFIEERTGQLKSELIQQVSLNKDKFVVKKVDGRGGDSVWVGTKLKQSDFDQVLSEVSKNPSVYIVQQYMHLSVLGENIVDLRAISAVLPDRIIVAETPWGRGLPKNGNGKVNISDQGREIAILIAKSKKPVAISLQCLSLLKAAN